MAGYNRNDTSNNIADGNVINASDLDGEFDALDAAFDESTGHTHDGTSGAGAPITKVGPTQDIVISSTAASPKTNNYLDLGTSLLKYKDLYLSGAISSATGTYSGQITSTVTTGTAPLVIASTTKVTNLNADLLDGADWAAPASIGSGTPAAGAFTTLSASGAFTANGGATLGDASGDALTINSSAVSIPNGLTFDGNVLSIDATNNRVGILNTNPSMALDVREGSIVAGTGGMVLYGRQSASVPSASFATGFFALGVNYTDNATGGLTIYTRASDTLTERMRISSTGSVGIGTTSDLGKLGVMSSTNGDTIAQFRCAGTGTARALVVSVDNSTGVVKLDASGAAAGSMVFAYGGTEAMRINTSGNVGIGTSSPAALLNVYGGGSGAAQIRVTSSVTQANLALYDNYDSAGNTRNWAFIANKVGYGDLAINQSNSQGGDPVASGTTRLYINLAGNIGVGTTSPNYGGWNKTLSIFAASAAAVEVAASTTTEGGNIGGFDFIQTSNTSNKEVAQISCGSTGATAGNTGAYLRFYTKPDAGSIAERMRLDSSGNLTVSTSATNTTTITPSAYIDFKNTTNTSGFDVGLLGGASDANSYIYQRANASMVFGTNNTEAMRITSAGNLGIGTTNPLSKLDVYTASTGGKVRISGNTDAAYGELIFSSSNATYAAYGASISSYGDGGGVDSGALLFNTGRGGVRAEKMRLDGNGNLGLGVTPSAWYSNSKALQVGAAANIWASTSSSNAAFSTNEYLDSTATAKYIISSYATRYQQYNGAHQWYTAPTGTAGAAITFTQAMTLDASGNLGIGTSSLSYKLDVNGTTFIRGNTNIYSGTGGAVNSSLLYFGSAALTNAAAVYSKTDTATAGNLVLATAQSGTGTMTERMRIDASGRLLVGLTGAGTYESNTKLNVYTSGTAQVFNLLQLTNLGTPNTGDIVGIGFAAGETTAYGVKGSIGFVRNDTYGRGALTFYTNNTAGTESVSTSNERLRIGPAGQLGIGGANYGTSGQALVSNGSSAAPSWQTVSGGQYFGSATTKAIAYNANTIGENVTVTAGNNGLSAGPITISTGFTVTVETGANWVIV
jgi:hypothetical protein